MEPDPELKDLAAPVAGRGGHSTRPEATESERVRHVVFGIRIYGSIAVTVIMGGGAGRLGPFVSQRADRRGPGDRRVVLHRRRLGSRTSVSGDDILSPSADTTTAFLDLSIRRCRRRLHALVAQALLYVAIIAFDLVWIYHYQTETRPMDPQTFLTSGAMLRHLGRARRAGRDGRVLRQAWQRAAEPLLSTAETV